MENLIEQHADPPPERGREDPMSDKERPGAQICANCGLMLALHHAANYADGPMIGRRIEVCPTAIFHPKPGEKMPNHLS
jgi:hypothetical protein